MTREPGPEYDVLSTYEGSPHGWSLDCVGLRRYEATADMLKRAFRWDEHRAEYLTELILAGRHDPTTIYAMDESHWRDDYTPPSWWVLNPTDTPYPPLPWDTK